ncbi:zinc-binding protein A33-like isoform X2 [Hypanus sabinus]|uniref:zinc-binding protein A33-like isoform X2 n=1 Tax=Hypanus sabinus TaxID=79690 RepID=UPI0028C39E78|nr:zinc-binding protein A33-like isoform X2 [Hypanus sabinus]
MPVNEAVEIYKDRVKSSLDSLTEKKSDLQEMEQQQKEKISRVREQSRSLQTHITSQFAELRQILIEKEQSILRDLREEEERILNAMGKNLRRIQENLNSIQKKFSKLQEQMDQKDSVVFLKDVEDFNEVKYLLYFFQEESCRKKRIIEEKELLSVADGALPVEKFDQPLLYTVWREMFHVTKLISVSLDVETAHPALEVSEDRKSVRWTRTRRDLSDTGKRFTNWFCVLASEGFTSGRHYWEMEVAGNQRWILGVATESVERKGGITLNPETGFWTVRRVCNEFHVLTSPPYRLPAGPIPGRVGIYLSYESGTVSFYNVETKSHLHTFTVNKFTEKLYPFFWAWDGSQWLRICSSPPVP